jgi:predicted nucleic acid-binding protein
MIIVSDTGPLAYLVEIGVVACLPKLYGEVFVPPTVLDELCHEHSPASQWANHRPDWLRVAVPGAIPDTLVLDEGEREAIALAIELSADYVLMDEKKGRSAAQAHGLKVAGTLAVLVDGAVHGLFDGLAALGRLETTNFYASAELLEAVRDKLIQVQTESK